MTSLAERLRSYLAVRRGLGCDLATTERILRRFVAFAEQEQAEFLSPMLFLRWKEQFGSANNNTWSARLGIVRRFAGWLQGFDSRNEVPPANLVTGRLRRARPYIYTIEQITQIVATAAQLPSDYGLRGLTCATLFGLIAVTGLRISEAIGLDDGDVDLNEAVVTVRQSKNGKSRWLPISSSTAQRLAAYRRIRTRVGNLQQPSFFQWDNGRRPTDCGLRYNFALVSQQLGLREPSRLRKHGRGPRVHDLRHTFAVQTILGWYRHGLDPDREMAKLSTYLGHSGPNGTYWYIEAVPELLRLAAERAERSLAQGGGR